MDDPAPVPQNQAQIITSPPSDVLVTAPPNNKLSRPKLISMGIIILLVVIASGSGGLIAYQQSRSSNSTSPNSIPISSSSNAVSTDQIATITETIVISPSISQPSPIPNTPTPTPLVARTVTVGGFTYEDRTNDGLYNSDDPKLPYMQLFIYDSINPNYQIGTIFSGADGSFTMSYQIKGSLILKPTSYNNFSPKSGQTTYQSSNQNIQVGFRSSSAPIANQNVGIIEGDVYQDSNRNKTRDSGENPIYFYKLYLLDSQGNYYNTVENAQTTDPGGHFKWINLPVGHVYTIRLSNPSGDYQIDVPETNISLASTKTEEKNVQIPVFKN